MSEKNTPEQNKNSEVEATLNFEIKEDGFAKYRDLMIKKQNMLMGILGGVGAAIIGNAVWIVIIQLGYKIDFLALGVGFFIAFGVKYLGKGIEPKFGYTAGVITLFSLLVAYFLIGCLLFAKGNHISFFSVFAHMNFTTAIYLLRGIIGALDVLFCLGSIGVAYYFSFKPLKEF
jgi:hypothetical protein